MKNLKASDGTYLLEEGLEKLHQESIHWVSEMDLWKLELDFFQKMLDKHSPQFVTLEQKKRLDHFQNLIIYYNGELIDSFIGKAKGHEKLLANEMVKLSELDERNYRNQHSVVRDEISAFRAQFHEYKKEFFEFIKPVI
jgi:hypothetical protein